MIKRPMKGVSALGQLDKLVYPFMAQPKYDGIRVISENGVALSASLKPLRNKLLQSLVHNMPDGIEFEFYLTESQGGLRKAASICNSEAGLIPDDATFALFDIRNVPLEYERRLLLVQEIASTYEGRRNIIAAPTSICSSAEAVQAELQHRLSEGYEGIMLKDPSGFYKNGRSTIRSRECLKLKPFEDAEGIVIGWKPEYENLNEQTVNELGLHSRSSSQLGKAAKPLVGALHVRSPRFSETFWVSGFTTDLKARLYAARDSLVGTVITFKHQPCAAYDAPRHPTFLRLRPTSI